MFLHIKKISKNSPNYSSETYIMLFFLVNISVMLVLNTDYILQHNADKHFVVGEHCKYVVLKICSFTIQRRRIVLLGSQSTVNLLKIL